MIKILKKNTVFALTKKPSRHFVIQGSSKSAILHFKLRRLFQVYFTSLQLMLLERNSLMRKSIWSSIFIAISSCSLVALLLLPDPIVFVAVVATLALTMATTIGFMGILGMHYNIATYIIVLLSIGTHLLLSFLLFFTTLTTAQPCIPTLSYLFGTCSEIPVPRDAA